MGSIDCIGMYIQFADKHCILPSGVLIPIPECVPDSANSMPTVGMWNKRLHTHPQMHKSRRQSILLWYHPLLHVTDGRDVFER
jgi:hypothetical protein